jgi:hypothetical protein
MVEHVGGNFWIKREFKVKMSEIEGVLFVEPFVSKWDLLPL